LPLSFRAAFAKRAPEGAEARLHALTVRLAVILATAADILRAVTGARVTPDILRAAAEAILLLMRGDIIRRAAAIFLRP